LDVYLELIIGAELVVELLLNRSKILIHALHLELQLALSTLLRSLQVLPQQVDLGLDFGLDVDSVGICSALEKRVRLSDLGEYLLGLSMRHLDDASLKLSPEFFELIF